MLLRVEELRGIRTIGMAPTWLGCILWITFAQCFGVFVALVVESGASATNKAVLTKKLTNMSRVAAFMEMIAYMMVTLSMYLDAILPVVRDRDVVMFLFSLVGGARFVTSLAFGLHHVGILRGHDVILDHLTAVFAELHQLDLEQLHCSGDDETSCDETSPQKTEEPAPPAIESYQFRS